MSVVVTPHPTVGLILAMAMVCDDWGPHPLDTHITSSLGIVKLFDILYIVAIWLQVNTVII